MSLTPIKYVNEIGVKTLGKTIPKVWIGTKEQYAQLDKTTLADNTIVNIVDDYDEYPIQVKKMPVAKEENQIVQYIGQTTSDYTNGFFYKCTKEENNLIWKNISVTNTYIPSNEEVLNKFSENGEGKVLYDNKPLASDNLWHGTQAEYNALGEYDENKTYVITDGDENADLSSIIIDDTKIDTKSTWSSKRINNYSNDEQIAGTYLDDKTIYRRNLEIPLDGEPQKNFVFINQGVTALEGGEDISIYVNQIMPTVDLSAWNIDTMVKVYGHIVDYVDTTKTERSVDLPYPVTYSAKAYVTGWYNYRTKYYIIRVGEQYVNRSTAFLTFEYTKK